MKHAMPKRETLGKVSTYLRNKGFTSGGQTDNRRFFRGNASVPNSVKVGKGTHVHRIRSSKQLRKAS